MRKQFTILLILFLFFSCYLPQKAFAQATIIPPKIISITPNVINSLTERTSPNEEFTLIGENLITGYRGEQIECGREKGPKEYPSRFGIQINSWTDTMIKFQFTVDIFDWYYLDGKMMCRIGYDTIYDGFQYTNWADDAITLTPIIIDEWSMLKKSLSPGDKITLVGFFLPLKDFTVKINNIPVAVNIIDTNTSQARFEIVIPNIQSGNIIAIANDGRQSNSLYVDIKTKPNCSTTDWFCGSWSSCSLGGTQDRTCNKILDCDGGTPSPVTSQSCTYIPLCTSNNWSCSDWSLCSSSGIKTRTCNKTSDCEGGVSSPATSQSCTYTPACTANSWSCGDWGICSSNGIKSRTCNKISNCEGGTQSPATTQSCSYTPACSSDTWQCGNWGTCSPQGVQTRSCTKTYDCPSAETAAPATSQYCEAPNKPEPQTPSENLGIANQSAIIKATVKLICPVSRTMASQGSGTVIDSSGTILTNKHVIDGTAGCLVGFIDDYSDEPYFGDRQIADIYKVSSDADAAVLKLRNPDNKILSSVNISQSNSSIKLGEILTTYGYPAKFGTKLTYTSGDFSGVNGDYLKTTAIIDSGNSGGGAYLKNGTFIGIPSAVDPGKFNNIGLILSINKINSWLNNSITYNYNNNNNYSRVSALLEDIDLSALGSLDLYIPGDDANITTATESQKAVAEEKSLITKIDKKLSKRVKGNILLQVEKNGEGWYVNPDNEKKYYLGRPADAFEIMRNLGLGIKHSELANYLKAKFPSRLSGKIMLDVEQKGEAYYVNPKDLKGYFLNRPADAFRVMRELGLGITNSDIRKINVGEIK